MLNAWRSRDTYKAPKGLSTTDRKSGTKKGEYGQQKDQVETLSKKETALGPHQQVRQLSNKEKMTIKYDRLKKQI